MNAIEYIHYGNRYAAINRCIMFVGELGKKLKDLNPKAAIGESNRREAGRIKISDNLPCCEGYYLDFISI